MAKLYTSMSILTVPKAELDNVLPGMRSLGTRLSPFAGFKGGYIHVREGAPEATTVEAVVAWAGNEDKAFAAKGATVERRFYVSERF
ncbi:hypothetical protein M427DRAFT_34290 [Gonapodya prolifera JEL478]|uniref:ABM domain-containing protein n=1 Tax=Gonapodya prolifera (strain JEL478) TaxID=1344416 RepID=A0A139A9H7_GONPJ|nr:hypothetical protein M427DRAFT_34290 [Gonapodya prolifera JEL478]|eukprot:KXS13053.1 hypothetical protein M427DRAFT_34290 [Gonapodya prolifera JEL478]